MWTEIVPWGRKQRSTEPNLDEDLHRLLVLKPWDDEERHRFDDRAVADLLRRNPGAAGVVYEFRAQRGTVQRYPIFRLVSLGASLGTVRLCCRACPGTLTERTETGGTALHAACAYNADVRVVRLLACKDPQAAQVTTRHGFTPLHSACAFGADAEVVRMLVDWYPQALNMTNKLAETPHMAAVNNGASAEVLAVLSSGGVGGDGGAHERQLRWGGRGTLLFNRRPKRRSAATTGMGS